MVDKILSETDVARLMNDPSSESRVETAAKLAREIDSGQLTASERLIAEDIFRLMARDAELRVREALSRHLKQSPHLPHDVALALARDVDTVALPVLNFSEVLTDSDLIEIVRSQSQTKQVAVASRPAVSSPVAEALVETHNEVVVTALVGNDGADIPEQSLQQVVEEFGESQAMQGKLVHRASLPITVAERLVTKVSENLRDYLIAHHDLPGDLTTEMLLQARERAVVGLAGESDPDQLEALVRHLHKNGRLTPSIILRALCMGDVPFFEAAMACLTGIPLVNSRIVVHDIGPLGLKTIFERANLPPKLFPAFRAAIDVYRTMDYDGGANDRERFSRRMMERILTQYGDLGVDFEADDLEYLLARMNKLTGLPE